jgi:hypothetical protein
MEELKCEKCGQPLNTLHWIGGKDMRTCDNGKCQAFHNPVTNLSYWHRSEEKTQENYIKNKDIRNTSRRV